MVISFPSVDEGVVVLVVVNGEDVDGWRFWSPMGLNGSECGDDLSGRWDV